MTPVPSSEAAVDSRQDEQRVAQLARENRELHRQIAAMRPDSDRLPRQQAEIERLRAQLRGIEASSIVRSLRDAQAAVEWVAPNNTLRGHIARAILRVSRRGFSGAAQFAAAYVRRLPLASRRYRPGSVAARPPIAPGAAADRLIDGVNGLDAPA